MENSDSHASNATLNKDKEPTLNLPLKSDPWNLGTGKNHVRSSGGRFKSHKKRSWTDGSVAVSETLPIKHYLLMTLMHLKRNYGGKDIADRFGISQPTFNRNFRVYNSQLAELLSPFIQYPFKEKNMEDGISRQIIDHTGFLTQHLQLAVVSQQLHQALSNNQLKECNATHSVLQGNSLCVLQGSQKKSQTVPQSLLGNSQTTCTILQGSQKSSQTMLQGSQTISQTVLQCSQRNLQTVSHGLQGKFASNNSLLVPHKPQNSPMVTEDLTCTESMQEDELISACQAIESDILKITP